MTNGGFPGLVLRMPTTRWPFPVAALMASLVAIGVAQDIPSPPGTAIPAALFALRELDFHLHSGMEREVELNSWLEMAAADGRKAVVLLDHLELYRKTAD